MAGLLEGLSATTTSGNVPRLRAEYPGVKVVDDQRFVDNGKIVTTGGLTAGIDGALHLVSRMAGKGTAQSVALGEEYDWRPEGGFVRGKLADANLMPWLDGALDGVGQWELVSTEGGTDRWEIAARGASSLSAAELLDRVGGTLSARGKWTAEKGRAAGSSPGTESRWRFTGRDGKPWSGTLSVQAVPAEPGRYRLELKIARAG